MDLRDDVFWVACRFICAKEFSSYPRRRQSRGRVFVTVIRTISQNRCSYDHQTWRTNVSRRVLETHLFLDKKVTDHDHKCRRVPALVFALLWVLASFSLPSVYWTDNMRERERELLAVRQWWWRTCDVDEFRSDDKRRLRLLEEELRMAKEATVRLHDDLMQAEERRQRHQDDLDRVKNTLNESESRRLCLQNQYDSAQTEVSDHLPSSQILL